MCLQTTLLRWLAIIVLLMQSIKATSSEQREKFLKEIPIPLFLFPPWKCARNTLNNLINFLILQRETLLPSWSILLSLLHLNLMLCKKKPTFSTFPRMFANFCARSPNFTGRGIRIVRFSLLFHCVEVIRISSKIFNRSANTGCPLVH